MAIFHSIILGITGVPEVVERIKTHFMLNNSFS